MANEPMTLRKLCAMLEPEFLDVPLYISVRDGHKNQVSCDAPKSLWEMPRNFPRPATNETGHLSLAVFLSGARLVKDRK